MTPARILLVYTGGTIGSVEDPDTGELKPFDFDHLRARIPEIDALEVQLDFESLSPIDSSDMSIERWGEMARLLFHRRDRYDGFVVLHGTDTMAYTASVLSFMLPHFRQARRVDRQSVAHWRGADGRQGEPAHRHRDRRQMGLR